MADREACLDKLPARNKTDNQKQLIIWETFDF